MAEARQARSQNAGPTQYNPEPARSADIIAKELRAHAKTASGYLNRDGRLALVPEQLLLDAAAELEWRK